MKAITRRWPLAAAAAAALYFLAARSSASIGVFHGGSSTLWPAAGVGVAIIVLLGRRAWPAITIAEFASAMVAMHGHTPLLALVYGLAQATEALVAGAILQRANFNPRLHRVRDVLWLLVPAAFVPALVSATIGVTAKIVAGDAQWASFGTLWRGWCLGHATGIVVLAPLLLTAAARRPGTHPHLPHGLRLIEGAAFGLLLCALVALAHFLPDGVAIALPPVLIWGALRFGPPGAALATAVMAGVGAVVAPHLSSSWHLLSPQDRLLVTQDLFSIGSLATLMLAAALAERQRLLEAHDALGRFATAVANELPPADLVQQIGTGGRELLGIPVEVVEGPEAPRDEVSAPVDVQGERWGWITLPGLTDRDNRRRFLNVESMLPRFATLLGVGVANTRAREALIEMAQTDPLTGLVNGRVFHERLADEMSRSRRYGRPVAVAMIDIDHFKVINDSVGHVGGDRVLEAVAQRVKSVMRTDSLVARLGGDEIAVILPESSAHGATIALQRARLAVSGTPVRPAGTVTLSAGICDSTYADTPERILELADDALYWSKLHGRDMAIAYSPDVVKPMSEDERMHRLTRSRALVGMKALARVIDARTPELSGHSERVAQLAGKLAKASDWSADMTEKLREAAAIHDVGMLTLDEELVSRAGQLTRAEEAIWRRHSEVGARMTAEVLDEDQTGWIRWHHERADGGGFPDGLTAEQLPEGAALLALANGWDRLVNGAPGRNAHSVEEALEICRAEDGSRFTHEAVVALTLVLAAEAEAEEAAAGERQLEGEELFAPTPGDER